VELWDECYLVTIRVDAALLSRVEVKVKQSRYKPKLPRGWREVWLYPFVTSALEGDAWSTPRPGRFTPGKTRYPLYRRLGGPEGWSGRVRKTLPPPGFDPRTSRVEVLELIKGLVGVAQSR
jgi:hypothetical protein